MKFQSIFVGIYRYIQSRFFFLITVVTYNQLLGFLSGFPVRCLGWAGIKKILLSPIQYLQSPTLLYFINRLCTSNRTWSYITWLCLCLPGQIGLIIIGKNLVVAKKGFIICVTTYYLVLLHDICIFLKILFICHLRDNLSLLDDCAREGRKCMLYENKAYMEEEKQVVQ